MRKSNLNGVMDVLKEQVKNNPALLGVDGVRGNRVNCVSTPLKGKTMNDEILSAEKIEQWLEDGFKDGDLDRFQRSHEALRKENAELKKQVADFELLKERLANGTER